ncbi:MAG: amino acid adenylation domain-containing protein [Acidobacteriota bacterium]
MNHTRDALVDRLLQDDRRYWIDQLSEAQAVTAGSDWPAGSRPEPRTFELLLDTGTAARVWEICGGRPALVLAALLAALKICLYKYSGERDITVGTPVHNDATRMGTGEIHLLPIRDVLDPSHTLRDLLRQVKQTLADAFAHQKYPLDRLARLGETIREPAALTRVVLLLEEIQSPPTRGTATPDLVLTWRCAEGRLAGTIAYDASRYAETTIAGVGARIERALRTIVFEPSKRLEDVSLLADAERAAVVATSNATAAPYPGDLGIHRLIEAQAAATPDLVAVRCGSDSMTYRALDATANQFARELRAQGLSRGSLVGIRMRHSIQEIVAVLGVLKAGAAYVPFDPAHPVERIRLAVDDARLAAIVGDADDPLTASFGCPAIPASSDWNGLHHWSGDAIDDRVSPDDLAYVIYTSGSTGRPKGVAIPHRALVNYVWWARDAYFAAGARDAALFTSLAFDLTVTSIFAPLIAGQAMVIYPSHDGEAPVLDVFRDGRVGVVKLTPSHLALLAGHDLRDTAIRTLVVGGEALETALARRVHEQFGGRAAIFNEYGPTEATVGCMIHRFDPQRDLGRSVPIGRPAANVQIHVLDAERQPVGDGMTGELFIAGDGLARGYLNRDDLTASAFGEHAVCPGVRMYRTGDRVRRLPGGALEFLGRSDDQIKLHGYRLDLDEYRHALNAHPQISDSVARLVTDDDGRAVLVAYYVARQEIDVSELRAFLGRRLIEGTQPQMFAHLRRLPLTLNGKVNIRALPGLAELRERLVPKSAEPRTPSELAIAGIWSDVLRVTRFGVHDSFFELGGHSLLATQVVSRIRDLTSIELPLRTIFEAPTIATLAARIDDARAAIVPGGSAFASAAPASAPIAARDPDQPVPLSFAQQRLWFLHELDSQSAVYNIATRLDVRGALRSDVLQRCFDEIVLRHESLRTTFVAEDGRPVQVIHPSLPTSLTVVDLASCPPDARQGAIAEEAARTFTTPFDLARGPLLRGCVLRLGPEDHVLLFAMHHIVGDGWSMGVLLREMAALYEALADGRPSPLPELALQYADYAVWQREHVSGALYDAQLAYWRVRLAGAPPLDLPTDRARPSFQTFRGGSVPFGVSSDLTDRVAAVSRRAGVTPFMTLLAVFGVFLHRYTGQDDITVGSPIANRHRSETEPIIGFFANTLVLRADLSGNPTFTQLLERVKETALGAYDNQDLPFERLVEELQPQRDSSHNPLFQVMCALNNAPAERPRFGALAVDRLPAETGTAKFDLNLSLDETSDGWDGTLDYNSDLFDRSTVERMAMHLSSLLRSACEHPDARLAELDLLSEEERRQIVVEWNRTRVAYPEPTCVHTLVEEVAARIPDAPAVAFGADTLTFAQLNARANQLAHRLRRCGVGPDVLVGVCLERSIEMAVAVLGVLKAGGAYVPLDPDYPAERLAFMVSDTAAPVVLAQPSTRGRLPASAATIVDVEAERAALRLEPATNPGVDVHPESLLYVIYTSGSTGRPKGTALSHRALGNLIRWHLQTLARGTAMLQFASLSFDASFHEMFAAWASGRLLMMIPEQWRRDPEELFPLLAVHGVETAILPVVVLHQWAEHFAHDPQRFSMLRDVITTGEQLVITKPIVDLFTALDRCTLHNHYGPSETHVITAFTLSRPPASWPSRPSIGRPIANSSVYILDTQLKPVPVGVYGELYLGGTNVARGYLGRPDLTASRFIPDPFSDEPGARLYAVGDVGRYGPDGTIEFKGRLDDQAKIRGFRVEPAEVETAINHHPAVSQSVVIVDGATPVDKRLVAYVVPIAGRGVTADELRAFLQARLPDYLVPAVVIVLPGLALTPNGKIDRRALPAPTDVPTSARAASRAPETPAEIVVAGLWKEVLGHDGAGVNDNFFQVGGHSLLATQLVSRVRRTFGVDVPVRVVFEAPTIAGLVDHLARATGGRAVVDEIADTLITVAQLTAGEIDDYLEVLRAPGEAPAASPPMVATRAVGRAGGA